MENIANTSQNSIEAIYDLKGSTYDRCVLDYSNTMINQPLNKMILKDVDFLFQERQIILDGKLREKILK